MTYKATTTPNKPKMTRKKKIQIITTGMILFGAAWWAWNLFHPQQYNSPTDIKLCQKLKNDLQLSVPHDAEYNDNLNYYNSQCASLTGGL